MGRQVAPGYPDDWLKRTKFIDFPEDATTDDAGGGSGEPGVIIARKDVNFVEETPERDIREVLASTSKPIQICTLLTITSCFCHHYLTLYKYDCTFGTIVCSILLLRER